jgi:hypothetical protein
MKIGFSGLIPQGNVYLKTALVEAANAAAKAKGIYLRGYKRAAVSHVFPPDRLQRIG